MGKTFKMVAVVGTSPKSYEDAIRSGVADAARSLRNISWFEVEELRGSVVDGAVGEFQAKIQLGLKVE